MTKEWHVWDFPDNIMVYFKEEFRLRLYTKLKEMCSTRDEIARKLESNKETIKSSLFLGERDGHKSYTFVRIVKKIVEVFGLQLGSDFLNEMDGNVVAYRSWNGWSVVNPLLPIKESPEFYSVVFHVMADGNASMRHSPYYSNTSPVLIEDFINKLQYFGKVEVYKKHRPDGLVYVQFPKAITDVLSHTLSLNFVRPTKLPSDIFSASMQCKSAAIRAFVDDEGSISNSGFVVKQKSKILLEELKLLLSLFYIRTGRIGVDQNGVHRFFIWKESWRNFRDSIGFCHPRKEFILDDLVKASHA